MVVTTSCGGGIPETLKYLESITRTWGFTFVNKLGVMLHPSVNLTDKSKKSIEQASEQFYKAIKDKKGFSPRLSDLLQFRIMKFNSIESSSYFSADYEFYNGKKDYYVNTKINIVKNKLAQIIEKLIIKMMGNNA